MSEYSEDSYSQELHGVAHTSVRHRVSHKTAKVSPSKQTRTQPPHALGAPRNIAPYPPLTQYGSAQVYQHAAPTPLAPSGCQDAQKVKDKLKTRLEVIKAELTTKLEAEIRNLRASNQALHDEVEKLKQRLLVLENTSPPKKPARGIHQIRAATQSSSMASSQMSPEDILDDEETDHNFMSKTITSVCDMHLPSGQYGWPDFCKTATKS